MASEYEKKLAFDIVTRYFGEGAAKALAEQQKLADATKDLNKEMGVVNVTQEDVEKITKKATEAFAENHHEIKKVGDELGRAAGLGRLGSLAIGGVAAAAFGAAKAVEFFGDTWSEIKETISGPIQIGLPDDAPAKITAAAQAWEAYATARAKVIAASNSPEAAAGREEKELKDKVDLIHQVMKAEEESAMASLKLKKDQMSPEAYKAAEDNIKNIFGQANQSVDQKSRVDQMSIKDREAFRLEVDARDKTAQALGIKAAPEDVAKRNQKALDENAANGEAAKKEIEERLALIDRFQKYKAGGDVAEYEGVGGKFRMLGESAKFTQRYGYWNDPSKAAADARSIETPRLAQAQAQIDSAETYRDRQQKNSSERARLMGEAGDESGKAAVIRTDLTQDKKSSDARSATDRFTGLVNRAATTVDNDVSAANNAGTPQGHQEAVTQLKESQGVGRELVKAAADAAASHSESLGAILKSIENIRSANRSLMDRLARVEENTWNY